MNLENVMLQVSGYKFVQIPLYTSLLEGWHHGSGVKVAVLAQHMEPQPVDGAVYALLQDKSIKMIQELRRKWGANVAVWGNLGWHCLVLSAWVLPVMKRGKTKPKCQGSYLFLSFSKTMTQATWPPKNAFFVLPKYHPVNISNHSTEMVAFIITACHRLCFSSLSREGLIPALRTPLAMVTDPSSSVWDLIWCPTTQDKLSVAPCTPCSISLEFLYSFNPALPNILLIMGKYFLLKWSRGKSGYSSLSLPGKFILIALIVTAGNLHVTLSCLL